MSTSRSQPIHFYSERGPFNECFRVDRVDIREEVIFPPSSIITSGSPGVKLVSVK
ncbi:hypothetical protein RRG08_065886, partial [Elysia crispata]